MKSVLAVAASVALLFSRSASGASSELRFLRDGEVVKTAGLAALKGACKLAALVIDDPIYKKKKSFLAFPLKQVLAFGFGESAAELEREEFFFEALDGYMKPAAGKRALEEGGYLAFGDGDLSHGGEIAWEPIDRRGADPGPYYVVWAKPGQGEREGYPWPFQLTAIEIVHFEKKFPHTTPKSAAKDSAAWRGFATFRTRCISCHAVNGEGGKVGPDLNVPKSIVEYRPIDQIKAYVRDPETFRHSNMPAHRDLDDTKLDELIAYFESMKTLKHDVEH